MILVTIRFILILMSSVLFVSAQTSKMPLQNREVLTGAEQTAIYIPMLTGKNVGIFANQTSMIGNTHLVDSLLKLGVKVVKIFGPEHGFRGKADAGEHIENGIDSKTGIQVISLYGQHKKPTSTDLLGIDMLLFDIQDVGVRFYTFISSLQYFMEAALENNTPLLILDRPNPNGFYIDGPVLDTNFRSFVGMQPIPVVYGMTIGEYASMLCGEKWLTNQANEKYTPEKIKIIKCEKYTHSSLYQLPINPSPNLKSMASIYWYPSICFFEGTLISEGRGTAAPFQMFGHPLLPKSLFAFTPLPNEGAKNGKCFYQKCYGWNVVGTNNQVLEKIDNKIQLKYLIQAYKLFPGKDSFFLKTNFFNNLSGNDQLMKQLKSGTTEEEIRKSWEPKLSIFKAIRKKYLLYKDFENGL